MSKKVKSQPKCIAIDGKTKFLVPVKETHNDQEALTFRYVDLTGKRKRSKQNNSTRTIQYCYKCEAPNGRRKYCRVCKTPLEEVIERPDLSSVNQTCRKE